MRNTLTRAKDFESMLEFANNRIGCPAVTVIELYAEKKRIAEHRAAKVFWSLVYSGELHCEENEHGIEVLKGTEERNDV